MFLNQIHEMSPFQSKSQKWNPARGEAFYGSRTQSSSLKGNIYHWESSTSQQFGFRLGIQLVKYFFCGF